MKGNILKLVLALLISAACAKDQNNINVFIMDFPHGEYRLHVKRTGEAYLYYGAKASAKLIRKNTFSAENLYGEFKQYLQPNLPREQWPNPKSQAGMVKLLFASGKEQTYLIFDLQDLTEKIFEKARNNIVGEF